MIKTNRALSVATLSKFMKLQTDIAEKIYDGSVPAFTENGFNSEDWQAKVLQFEVGKSDKGLIQKTFDFSIIRTFK